MLGIIHLIHCPLLIVYPYVTNKYDYSYIFYFLMMATSYLFLENECLISYCAKKQMDKNYVLGSNLSYYPEMHIFTKNDQHIKLYFTTTTIIYLHSLSIVLIRIKYVYLV